MLSYFAAWILKAGTPVFKKRSGLRHRWGKTGGGRSRQLRDHGSYLARELQVVQENARLEIVRGTPFSGCLAGLHQGAHSGLLSRRI
jgi:hypothetical protein